MNKLMSARNKKTKLAKKDAVTGFIFSLVWKDETTYIFN